MTRRTRRLTALLLAAATAASSCSGKDKNDTAASSPGTAAVATPTTAGDSADTTAVAPTTTAGSSATTPSATGQVGSVTWATYREVNSLDPIYSFDYPENTVIYSMCESLLSQQPDGSIQPGITTVALSDRESLHAGPEPEQGKQDRAAAPKNGRIGRHAGKLFPLRPDDIADD